MEKRFEAYMCGFLKEMYSGETKVKVKTGVDADGKGTVKETMKKTCPPIWVRDALVEGAGMKKMKTLFKWDECVPGADMPQPEA